MRKKYVITISTSDRPLWINRVRDVLEGRVSFAVMSIPHPSGGYVIVEVMRAYEGACREDKINALLPNEGNCSYYTSEKNVRDAIEYLREFLLWGYVMPVT